LKLIPKLDVGLDQSERLNRKKMAAEVEALPESFLFRGHCFAQKNSSGVRGTNVASVMSATACARVSRATAATATA
jgi:hypothetical protein